MRLSIVDVSTGSHEEPVVAEMRADGRFLTYRRAGAAGLTVSHWFDVTGTQVADPVDAPTGILIDELIDAILVGPPATASAVAESYLPLTVTVDR